MKHRRLSTRGLLILFTCIFLGCVFFLSAFAFYLDKNGVGPEEDAVSAVFYLNGPYLYQEEFTDEFCVKIDSQQGIADLRALEKSVKNMTLKEYTSLIVWEGTFTYIKADGMKEQNPKPLLYCSAHIWIPYAMPENTMACWALLRQLS